VVPNEELSSAYLTQAEATLKSQIVYGGARLSELLKTIYGGAAKQVQL
jgi:hypothetical protein